MFRRCYAGDGRQKAARPNTKVFCGQIRRGARAHGPNKQRRERDAVGPGPRNYGYGSIEVEFTKKTRQGKKTRVRLDRGGFHYHMRYTQAKMS